MNSIRPLPPYLVQRFHGWKAVTHRENQGWFRRLAEEGQRPRAMIITCCDSRVHVSEMFGATSDELFIHSNIAALVPPHGLHGKHPATSAAIEYAVTTLRVSHVIVLGHADCGGVRGCHDMCNGRAPQLLEDGSLVGRWLDILRPATEALPPELPRDVALRRLEHDAVLLSMQNLVRFPMVRAAVAAEAISLHGLWIDLAGGNLESYDPERGGFVPV